MEAAAVSVVASASNALVTLCKHVFEYAEVPGEVEQFRHAIENLETSIKTTKRLRRVKSEILDKATKEEVDKCVERSEMVLNSISSTIEGCRVDLQTKGTIRVKNKLDWILRGHQTFMARGVTLNSCIQVLGIQIGRMDSMLGSETCVMGGSPPSYSESFSPRERYLRAPAARKRRSRVFSNASQISLGDLSNTGASISEFDLSSEKEVVISSGMSTGSDPETSSVFSFEEQHQRPTARILSVIDLSCGGDYCTNEFCVNHDNSYQRERLVPTQSLDLGSMVGQADPIHRTLSEPTPDLSFLRPPSQRRRHKSGLV